jgi:signal transduction histidine kinase
VFVKRIGQTRIEWILLGIIAVVCVVLSFLQYRWTGDLSRAEPALLRAGLNEQVRRLVQSFNEEIRENCMTLLPDAKEITQRGPVEAHRMRYAQWISSHDRSFFKRIGIAVRERGTLRLYDIDDAGRIAPLEWPDEWETLRAGMTARINGVGRPPNTPPDSNLIETPLFPDASTRGAELEWMIFELNNGYLRTTVLPHLVAEYLNPDRETVYDVSVSWANPGGSVIFSTRSDGSSVATKADATGGIFSADMGVAPAGRRGRFRDERVQSRWTIAVRHRAGSLNAAVSRARTRNLIASLLLVGLLGGTALALVRYTARSRRLSEMQFDFATGVSHDLRTPLTAIRGAAFNLVEGVVSEPAAIQRYLKLILRNAEELTSMIENVLAFSASMRMQEEERHETFALSGLIQRAAATMTQEIEQAGCNIEVTIAPELPAVEGDVIALELVFRNLIGNAVRHGAGGKWIGVSAAACGGGVEVRVCDHGPGIPEGERERIFEPFYRGEQTRAQRVPGTGLGLCLVKNTIGRHNGTIHVNNTLGGGAQFTVRLPAVPEII